MHAICYSFADIIVPRKHINTEMNSVYRVNRFPSLNDLENPRIKYQVLQVQEVAIETSSTEPLP